MTRCRPDESAAPCDRMKDDFLYRFAVADARTLTGTKEQHTDEKREQDRERGKGAPAYPPRDGRRPIRKTRIDSRESLGGSHPVRRTPRGTRPPNPPPAERGRTLTGTKEQKGGIRCEKNLGYPCQCIHYACHPGLRVLLFRL